MTCFRLKAREGGAACLSQRFTTQPGGDTQDIQSHSRQQMLQMGLDTAGEFVSSISRPNLTVRYKRKVQGRELPALEFAKGDNLWTVLDQLRLFQK